jgi:hypothetical protein
MNPPLKNRGETAYHLQILECGINSMSQETQILKIFTYFVIMTMRIESQHSGYNTVANKESIRVLLSGNTDPASLIGITDTPSL